MRFCAGVLRIVFGFLCVLFLAEFEQCTVRDSCIPYDGTCNPALTVLLFSSFGTVWSNPPGIIFFTTATTSGNTGGIPGADVLCNSDASKPANTGTYKALISLAGVRVASVTADMGDGQVDWVLRPNTVYTRPDGTVIMTTNSASIRVFGPNLTNAIGTSVNPTWTGLNTDWTAAGGCANWTDGSGGPFGRYGVINANTLASINGGNQVCSSAANMYCVQQ